MDQSDQSSVSNQNPEQLFQRLVKATHRIDTVLSPRHVMLAGDPSVAWLEIAKMPTKKQLDYIDRFEFFTDVCVDAIKDNFELLGDDRLIWHAISKLKVKPSSDLFSLLSSEDYIEIYDVNGIQVFRNFEFCKLITYTLHEMLILPWSDLYGRDEKIMAQIFAAVDRVFRERRTITDLGIDEHVAIETRSNSGRSFKVRMKYFSPLFGDHQSVPLFLAGSSIERLT